jgi:hypothetical protein
MTRSSMNITEQEIEDRLAGAERSDIGGHSQRWGPAARSVVVGASEGLSGGPTSTSESHGWGWDPKRRSHPTSDAGPTGTPR